MNTELSTYTARTINTFKTIFNFPLSFIYSYTVLSVSHLLSCHFFLLLTHCPFTALLMLPQVKLNPMREIHEDREMNSEDFEVSRTLSSLLVQY